MTVCAGITRGGERCTQSVKPGKQYCHRHDPDRAEGRSRAASRAGKSKPNREIQDVKVQLQALADSVLSGELDRADASVCGQLLNIKLRALEIERKIKETEELEERIQILEARQEPLRRRY